MNELVLKEKSQNAIAEFASNYVLANNIILSKDYNLGAAMTSLYLNLIQVKDKNNQPALESCSPETIQEAVIQCINKELDVSKSQGYFIPRGGKLCFDTSYFGKVKQARDLARVKIVGFVIREGEACDLERRIDGTLIVHHKPDIKCLNNKIIAAAAVATDIDTGRVDRCDIMSLKEILVSISKSPSGGAVSKEFQHEMYIRTVVNRLAKHYINESDNKLKVFVTGPKGEDMLVRNYDELPDVDVDYTINTDEQIASEKAKYEPKEEHIVTSADLKLDDTIVVEPEPKIEIPEGAIEIDYNEVKGGKNKDKYKVIPNSFNKATYTCWVMPL